MNLSSKYQEILFRLFAQNTNPKFGLSRIKELFRLMGIKKDHMYIIQVVGTNGKGSSVAFIESVLKENGISCGLFTSPHLSSARERIRLDGEMVSEDDFVSAATRVLERAQHMSDAPSFFECMLAMALWLFKKYNIKVAILEAGLGGRLDATSAIEADILGVSIIDLDHQKILGTSISAIAHDKIAAARASQKVVAVEQESFAMAAIKEAQESIGFELKIAEPSTWPLGLFGKHQTHNAGLALSCLKELGFSLDENKTRNGLKKVNWPGRFEIISFEPVIIFDGAHNPSGIRALIEALNNHDLSKKKPVRLVFGSMESPNTREKIALLVKNLLISEVICHCPKNSRSVSIEELAQVFMLEGVAKERINSFSSWPALIEKTKNRDEVILVCGSLYTVGEARGALLAVPKDPLVPNY